MVLLTHSICSNEYFKMILFTKLRDMKPDCYSTKIRYHTKVTTKIPRRKAAQKKHEVQAYKVLTISHMGGKRNTYSV